MDQPRLNWSFAYIWGIANDGLRGLHVHGRYRNVILPMTVPPPRRGARTDIAGILEMTTALEADRAQDHGAALRLAAGQAFQQLRADHYFDRRPSQ